MFLSGYAYRVKTNHINPTYKKNKYAEKDKENTTDDNVTHTLYHKIHREIIHRNPFCCNFKRKI